MLRATPWVSSANNKATLQAIEIGLPRVAYDITFEMVDCTDGDFTHEILMRKDLYSLSEAQRLAKSYQRLIQLFTASPNSPLDSPNMFGAEEMRDSLKFSRGQCRIVLFTCYNTSELTWNI
jgi:hybrid polyketide synthase / nonribosomal peptide synthetase ACE1